MEFKHKPVLLSQTLEALNIKQNGIYVDGTVGGGGHSIEILKKASGIKLIAIDRDKEALNAAKKRLSNYENQIVFIHDNYKNIPDILNELNLKADGILLDLGVSSYQIDNNARGFSFKHDAELDMRMNQSQNFSAKNVVNEWSEEELFKIISTYGEEKFAYKISKEIVKNRPVNTTTELANIIDKALPLYKGRDLNSTLQRVFQAIRIEVNDELEGLNNLILKLPSVMNNSGRIAIISFHSLEDRIVKQAFKELSRECICPPSLPICVCNHKSKGKTITNKPIIATNEEIKENSRSTSAKLRIFETV